MKEYKGIQVVWPSKTMNHRYYSILHFLATQIHISYFKSILCYNLNRQTRKLVCVRKIAIIIMDDALGNAINNGRYPKPKV